MRHRQPHAPLILTGGQHQPAIARIVQPRGQHDARDAANAFIRQRMHGPLILVGGQHPGSVAKAVQPRGERDARDAALFLRRVTPKPIILTIPIPPAAPSPPIGKIIRIERQANFMGGSRYRPPVHVYVLRGGGLLALGKIVQPRGERAARDAAANLRRQSRVLILPAAIPLLGKVVNIRAAVTAVRRSLLKPLILAPRVAAVVAKLLARVLFTRASRRPPAMNVGTVLISAPLIISGGGGPGPVAPSLSVADNGDGSGGVATVSGSSVGSSNTVYAQTFSGSVGVGPVTTCGTVSGNGTVPCSLAAGYYFFWVVSTLNSQEAVGTAAWYGALTNVATVLSVHWLCLEALQARIIAKNLTNIPSANILVRKYPSDRAVSGPSPTIPLPAVLITEVGYETEPGGWTGMDDIGYPCLITLIAGDNQDLQKNQALELLWRQTIYRATRHQTLAGAPTIETITVEPGPVIDAAAFKDQNLFVSSLLVRCVSREPRG